MKNSFKTLLLFFFLHALLLPYLLVQKVREKMEFINRRMKGVLAKMGRGGDKLCIDIMCIVLAIGLGGVLWKGVGDGGFF